MINWFIETKQKRYLKDQELSQNTDEDMIFITLKIYVKNLMKIIGLIIKIAIVVYFTGNCWFVLVSLQHNVSLEFGNESSDITENHDSILQPNFFTNESWSITTEL